MDFTLSHNIIDQIERAYVDVGGERCPVRFVGVRPSPAPPLEPIAAELTAETTCEGRPHRVTVHLGLDRLSTLADEPYVVRSIVGGLRKVILGELPPGMIDYL